MRRKLDHQYYTADDYERKLQHMIKFMEQESIERAQEIDNKSEEEYNIVKGNMIQNERLRISKQYEAKENHCKNETIIEQGKVVHMTQMQIVENKLKIYDDLYHGVTRQIKEDMLETENKLNLLQNLIMEALFKLLEKQVVIRCRQSDVEIIKSIIPQIEKDYKLATGKTVKLGIDEVYLPCGSLPGVICKTPNNKIFVNNTLDDRVKQVLKSSLPVMNRIFFGTSRFK